MLIQVRRFIFEITHNSVFIQVPYIGALFVGAGLPTVFDRWSEVRRFDCEKSLKISV
ncbi:MAG: hypothetical protein AB7E51_07960 [Pseudodesulfovibrio sp.]|uniref:Uncharacterized protein n=1 Tax=Pseudodesulfovibrio indicus TaxID=1716143 RepID=A0AA94PQ55_9BACT|nr:hypothetical protein [Pseudodesulfovibrio indicus]TDT89724.1 hypothetical protein EDC59_10318 [Pseudodesulfovibrio indicus]